ncbi:MAG TPA: tetratricopeptide repeat-containing glycosyltransferase family protein [Alphaproteobacteria bacterium]|jgi:Flp pilus assembly protein TadD|nr:tetratricopeptide repeat-containing glycosyltransferase family protein [Alphaproteobacteria bacterium]
MAGPSAAPRRDPRPSPVPPAGAPPADRAAAIKAAEALHADGLRHQQAGRLDEARAAYEAVLVLVPEATVTRSNLGNVLRAQGDFAAAIAAQRAALADDPNYAHGWSNLALALQDAGHGPAAVSAARHASTLAPTDPEIRYTQGTIELALGQAKDAIDSFLAVLGTQPRHSRALLNLAVALKECGATAAGATALETLIAFEPDNADAHFNLALNLLAAGEWARGFPAYEWRLRVPGLGPSVPSSPRWDGTPQPGKTLLLVAEQGLGDTFQFVRFALRARARVGRVVLAAQKPLLACLAGAVGIDTVVDRDAPLPAHDLHLPLMSLPFALDVAAGDELGETPWLAVDHDRKAEWRDWLDRTVPARRLRVGIAWRGNPAYRKDATRSLALANFVPLTALSGVSLISLQKGPGEDEWRDTPEVRLLQPPDLDRDAPFVDTAALLESLDLVICSDSALTHLAGALGRPTWILLSHRPDWRWGDAGTETPWYSSATLIRQAEPGDWSGVFGRAAAALAALSGGK